MAVTLDCVVPFGRSLDEYRKMFALSEEDLQKTIVGVADGPASFNAEMQMLGRAVLSVDPLYVFDAKDIKERFYAVVEDIMAQVEATPGDWVWSYHPSPDALKTHRMRVVHRFTGDYAQGKAEGRYVVGALPALPFADAQFRLAVCSHFLFLYSKQWTFEWHKASVLEMLRIAEEVRIFPLLTLLCEESPYLHPLVAELRAQGFIASIERVAYELQRGGNQMLRIRRAGS